MIVDTGTGANVIAGWLARALALPTTKLPRPTHDPSGRPVLLERCDRPQIAIDGFAPLPDRPTAVVELPAAFERAGIGALLSPQTLADARATVVLDLPRKELRRVRSEDLPATDTRDGASDLDHPVLCRGDGAGFGNTRLTADVLVDGVSTTLEVDTGAIGSPLFLAADTEAGRSVLVRGDLVDEKGFSAAGAAPARTAHGVPVQVNGQTRRLDVSVIAGTRDVHCGVEGRLGFDWLRSCVLSIGEREHRLRCAQP
jgi:hypothetical protein